MRPITHYHERGRGKTLCGAGLKRVVMTNYPDYVTCKRCQRLLKKKLE